MAKILKTATNTVTFWETNRHIPHGHQASKIIQFLGYFPFKWKDENLYTKVKYARLVSGHSLEKIAKELNCDQSILFKERLTHGKFKPEVLKKIEDYISKYLGEFSKG